MTSSKVLSAAALGFGLAATASAIIVTNPNDPRDWQGATVGTFASLVYGSDTPANRQLVVDNQLLDDGRFALNNYQPAQLLHNAWSDGGGGGALGESYDLTGTGSYGYGGNGGTVFGNANSIDNTWFQSGNNPGDTVFDLGTASQYAAVFPVIDHGPLPQESIESTVYLSSSPTGPWTQADLKLVFLEGFQPNDGILWDGFSFVVQPQGGGSFRYLSIIHGGPGALWSDGDDEINGVLGLPVVPAPAGLGLLGLAGLVVGRRRR